MLKINLLELDPVQRVKYFMLEEGIVTKSPDITKRDGYSARLICDRLAQNGYNDTSERSVEQALLEDAFAGLAVPKEKTVFADWGPIKETSFALSPEGVEYYRNLFKLMAETEI
jgi:hypothetical protein